MSNSVYDKINRVRKPRVHITYDLETNGAMQSKELPFVMGVMGDYSGDSTKDKKPLKDRSFTQIDRDNLDDVMSKISPSVDIKVENTIEGDGSEMSIDLSFNKMEDFEPQNIVKNIEPLNKLMETRNKLRDLLTKADRSEDLENLLEEILNNTDTLSALQGELDTGEETKDKE